MNFIDALEQDSEVSYEPYKVGDLDMAGISWTVENSSSSVKNIFLDDTNAQGPHQMIRKPTRGTDVLDHVSWNYFDSVWTLKKIFGSESGQR